MDTGRLLEYWRDKAYGNETPSKIAEVIPHEVEDLIRNLKAGGSEAEAKTAIGDILAMLQEICTLKRWDLPSLHMTGCQRAAQRAKECIRDYILDAGFPRFYCWANPKPVGKAWAFGWLTGLDGDLVCIFPRIKSRVMEHWALSPVHSNLLVALTAFAAKRFVFHFDHNMRGL